MLSVGISLSSFVLHSVQSCNCPVIRNKNFFMTETILPLLDVRVLKVVFNLMVIFTNFANCGNSEFLTLIVPGCCSVAMAV